MYSLKTCRTIFTSFFDYCKYSISKLHGKNSQLVKDCSFNKNNERNIFILKNEVNFKSGIHFERRQSAKDAHTKSSKFYEQTIKKSKSFKISNFTITGGCLTLLKKRRKESTNASIVETVSEEKMGLLSQEELDETDSPTNENEAQPISENAPLTTTADICLNKNEPIATETQISELPERNPDSMSSTATLFQQSDEPQNNGLIVICCANTCASVAMETGNNKQGTAPTQTIKSDDKVESCKQPSLEPELAGNAGIQAEIYNLKSPFEEKKLPKKRKKKSLDEKESGKKRMERPNYFIGIQVSNPTIHENLKKVQDKIIEGERQLKPALISLSTLHLTLLVFRIDDDEELERASEALRECYEEIKTAFTENPLNMDFQGLSDFNKKVLFAKINSDESVKRLTDLADTLTIVFEKTGLSLAGHNGFKPHLTILKLSKLKQKKIKFVNEDLYEEFVDADFGNQTVKSLQLLSMSKPRTEAGYYQCDKEYYFDVPNDFPSPSVQECVVSPPTTKSLTKDEVKKKISSLTKAQLEAMAKEEK